MRLVAVADTHTFQDNLGALPDGDVFIHAGDMLRAGTLEELGPVAAWIRALPHLHKVVVAGNHDWCFARNRQEALALLGPGVVYLEDSPTTIGGLRFWGSPWQPAYNDWAYNLPPGQPLRDKWAMIPQGIDVLVTHGPPAGFGDRGTYGPPGCAELLAAVRQVRPTIDLFGHVHTDGGFWLDGRTALCNVTTWESERPPTVIDVDPVTRTVTPVVIPKAG